MSEQTSKQLRLRTTAVFRMTNGRVRGRLERWPLRNPKWADCRVFVQQFGNVPTLLCDGHTKLIRLDLYGSTTAKLNPLHRPPHFHIDPSFQLSPFTTTGFPLPEKSSTLLFFEGG